MQNFYNDFQEDWPILMCNKFKETNMVDWHLLYKILCYKDKTFGLQHFFKVKTCDLSKCLYKVYLQWYMLSEC